MQLKLKRTQREGGIVSKNVIFCLDARIEFAAHERQSINRYKLQSQVLYNSEAQLRLLDKSEAQRDGSLGGNLKSLATLAFAATKLRITIASLERGQHIECKSLDELLGAEDAIMTACQNLKGYLATASTFDGREVVVDFDDSGPRVVAHAATPDSTLIAPRQAASPSVTVPLLTSTSAHAEPSDTEDEWEDGEQEESQFSIEGMLALVSDRANRPEVIGAGIVLLLLLTLFNCRG